MRLSDLKVGDVLVPKRARVPKVVTQIFNKKGDYADRIDHVRSVPLDQWKGQTFKTCSSCAVTFYRDIDLNDYKLDGNINEAEGTNTMSKLFKVIGEEVYGIHIGTNTAGELVLEIRGDANNAIKAYKKTELEEVKPYTVKLVILATGGNPRHATVEKGKLKKNDVIVWSGAIWSVAELDTKQDNCPEITSKNASRLVVGEL